MVHRGVRAVHRPAESAQILVSSKYEKDVCHFGLLRRSRTVPEFLGNGPLRRGFFAPINPAPICFGHHRHQFATFFRPLTDRFPHLVACSEEVNWHRSRTLGGNIMKCFGAWCPHLGRQTPPAFGHRVPLKTIQRDDHLIDQMSLPLTDESNFPTTDIALQLHLEHEFKFASGDPITSEPSLDASYDVALLRPLICISVTISLTFPFPLTSLLGEASSLIDFGGIERQLMFFLVRPNDTLTCSTNSNLGATSQHQVEFCLSLYDAVYNCPSHLIASSPAVSTASVSRTASFDTTSGSITATGTGAKTPSHKINGGTIAGGIVGVVIVIGATIALLLCRRRRRAPGPTLTTSTTLPSPEKVPSLTMTAGGQTVLAIDQPIARSVVETREEVLSKITEQHRRSQRVNASDREESGSQNVAGPGASGAALEIQMRAMAERMALMETQLQMRSLADEQPPGYTAV
ncbi:hypothetical protein GGX14DRAFT_400923 [Mycena pura]|uniref:Uncharacterized protein n=1 Tax=Mycena pura TaxID=153505 RepID=A0AAD6V101_9AGAR|nr:hypothetical protein GGX14DRAFT_400923 [Mycena pura]